MCTHACASFWAGCCSLSRTSASWALIWATCSGTFFDGTAAYLLRSFWLVLALAVIGCTSLPKRLWRRWEDGMSIAVSDTLRTVWAVLVLLVSVAFLVGDSYNPFLYFRF